MRSRVPPTTSVRHLRRRRVAVLAVLLACGFTVPVAVAQDEDSVASGMPLTAPVKSSLAALQEDWLQWDSAFLRGDQTSAEVAVSDLLHTGADLGMTRLPDLCVSLLARAAEAAAAGSTGKARWAVEMAERLDPGSHEVPMAAAVVARYESRYLQMLGHQLRAYTRVLSSRPTSHLLRENLLLWAIASALVAGALFVALQLAAHGSWLIEDLAEIASRMMPVPTAAYFVALVLVILPILIPSAWVVLPFYWAILLAPYALKRERIVLAVLLAFVLWTPWLLQSQAGRVRVELSDGVRAVRSLQAGSLYGGLFKDIQSLRNEHPSNAAVLHVTADLHTNLGQMEYARLLYEELLEMEPTNFGAHNNLGGYYLGQRNTGKAIEHFQRSTSLAPDDRLEPYRNLYKLYRDYLAFDEAESVLAEVRVLAPDEVVKWVRDDAPAVTLLSEGYLRLSEIGTAAVSPGPADESEATEGLPPGLAAQGVFLLIACLICWQLFVRSPGRRLGSGAQSRLETFAPWVPGLGSVLQGRGERAYPAVLIPVAILLLPRMSDLGYPLRWGIDKGEAVLWVCALFLLADYFLIRWLVRRWRLAHVV